MATTGEPPSKTGTSEQTITAKKKYYRDG